MSLELTKEILGIVWRLFITPWTNYDVLWLILPLVLILLLIHIYFGRHRAEELGWNSAFGNSISLFWICIILFRFLFQKYDLVDLTTNTIFLKNFAIVTILSFWVILLMGFNFYHKLPKKFAYLISSSDSLYVLAYVVISIVMGEINVTNKVFAGAIILFIILILALQALRFFIPMSKGSKISKALKKKNKRKKKMARKIKSKKSIIPDNPISKFMRTKIISLDHLYLDLWSIVHLITGFLLGILIAPRFSAIISIPIVFALLSLWEIFEYYTSGYLFFKETTSDKLWDLIIGMIGLYLYYVIFL